MFVDVSLISKSLFDRSNVEEDLFRRGSEIIRMHFLLIFCSKKFAQKIRSQQTKL